MTTAEACSPKAIIPDLLTLRVDSSSSISGNVEVKALTESLRNWTSTNGVIYQWTFLLSQLAQELVITNGTFGFDPYQGPQCCITLQSSIPGDLPWPDRADCPIPSVVAELTLLSGDSMAYKDLPDLRKAIFGAIQKYFCPCDQKVWISVTSRQITEEERVCGGVGN